MMPEHAQAGSELLDLVPRIARARGYRLYAENGRRLIDLWADGGRTVLGRKPEGRGRLAKELLDRGLVSGLPSPWECRLLKALGCYAPGLKDFRLFPSEAEAQRCLEAETLDFGVKQPFDDLRMEAPRTRDLSLLVLPLEPAFSPGVIASSGSLPHAFEISRTALSPFKAALASRAISAYLRLAARPLGPHWGRADRHISGLFRRSGPWLYPEYSAPEHERVFREALSLGILISPDYGSPSMLPPEFDKGEIALLGRIQRASVSNIAFPGA